MNERLLVERLRAISAADYVRDIRAGGREALDPLLRADMADLYQELRPLMQRDGVLPRTRRLLQLTEPLLEAEWALFVGPDDAGRNSSWPPVLEQPGKQYATYANLRVLNQVLGVHSQTPVALVEKAAWRTIRYLCATWAAYEERSLAGTEKWNPDRCPTADVLRDRVAQLRILAGAGDRVPSLAAPEPPLTWSDYLLDEDRLRLEFLTALPQTTHHEEVTFLRTIHLTEACLTGILAVVITAIERLQAGLYAPAAGDLARATDLARMQNSVFTVMKTMRPDDFMAFRQSTGNASAVQSIANHLLHIFVHGVDRAKVDAIARVPTSVDLLRYDNPNFVSLSVALESVPSHGEDARAVLVAAAALDGEMYRWRASHYGVARRYLPEETAGTGGTSGAAYLKTFYAHRVFGHDGRPCGNSATVARPARGCQPHPGIGRLN